MKVDVKTQIVALPDGLEKARRILRLTERQLNSPPIRQALTEVLYASRDVLTRFVAARSLARSHSGASGEVIEALLDVLKDAVPVVKLYMPIADREYDAVDEVCICLMLVGSPSSAEIVPHLLQAMDRYTGFNAAMMAAAALHLAFQAVPIGAQGSYDGLDNLQKQVLNCIVASRRAWRFNLLGCNSPVLAPSPVLDSSALSGVETL